MPSIDPKILDCAVYLYRSPETAAAGVAVGGTGFLVGMRATDFWEYPESPRRGDYHHVYAVSNRHVVKDEPPERDERGNPIPPSPNYVVRLNTHEGRADTAPVTLNDWVCSDEDDLAVVAIAHSPAFKYRFIDFNLLFSDPGEAARHRVGIGDEVFMVGRFVNHDGQQRNAPTIRFGHIAAMPDEPIRDSALPLGAQAGLLVELHSISGFSGSPVFVRPDPTTQVLQTYPSLGNTTGISTMMPVALPKVAGPWLLGVDCAHVWDWKPIKSNRPSRVQVNTGMAVVVPSWKLRDLLLNDGRLKNRRLKQQEEWVAAEKASRITMDTSNP